MTQRRAWGAMLLRVTLGVIVLVHGWEALTLGGSALRGVIVGMGYPENLAPGLVWYLIIAQIVGGLLLTIGVWTTAAALVQLPIMASAAFLMQWPGSVVVDTAGRWAIGSGRECALLGLLVAIAVALIGPGALSFDDFRRSRRTRFRMP